MAYNSTIEVKKKICIRCGKPCIWFSRKRCQQCAKIEDFHDRAAKHIEEDEGIRELRDKLDTLVSKWVRYSSEKDESGLVKCYTCNDFWLPADLDAGHYITRNCMHLRFDVSRNIRPQCRNCNRSKNGKAAEFGRNLELEMPGVTEILLEESYIVYKWSRDELRSLILEFSQKIKIFNQ